MSQDCATCPTAREALDLYRQNERLQREIADIKRQIEEAKRLCLAASDRWQQTAARGNTPRARWAWTKGQGRLGEAVLARLP